MGFTIYLIMKMFKMSKRNNRNKRMLAVLDQFSDEEAFYKAADEMIATEKDAEYVNKTRVLRIWADVRYEHDEMFKKDLELLDLKELVTDKPNASKAVDLNEDSLFYLYLAIPNRLYYRNRLDLLEPLDQKLKDCDEETKTMLVRGIAKHNRMYYNHEGDLGESFYKNVLAGDYGEYRYSKHLISMYKRIVATMLGRIALDRNDLEMFEEQLSFMEVFENSPLGERWLMELDIELPKAEDSEEVVDEKEEKE